jgi:hypothetical protein
MERNKTFDFRIARIQRVPDRFACISEGDMIGKDEAPSAGEFADPRLRAVAGPFERDGRLPKCRLTTVLDEPGKRVGLENLSYCRT